MADLEYNDLEELGANSNVDELTEKFLKASNHLPTLLSKLDNNTLLTLYAYYKQGLEGPCNTPKPSWYDMRAKSKWEAWRKLADMPQTEAKQLYVQAIETADPEFEYTAASRAKEGWVTVSTLQSTEPKIKDCDKSVFDYAKDGDTEKLRSYLLSKPVVNERDSDGLGLIHWASDRGFLEILQLLLSLKADVNLRDAEGQTALHYAASCGYVDCVEFLIKNGADTKAVDSDGLDALSVSSEMAIKELLAHK